MGAFPELLKQPWFQIAFSVVLFAAGFAASTFYFLKSRRKSQIAFHHVRRRLLGYPRQDLPNEIEFKFRGEPIKKLDRIRVMFWNNGNTTIGASDRVAADEFRLLGNFRVIDVRVTKATRDVNNVCTEVRQESPADVRFYFDYLDPGDGAIVEVLCDGLETYDLKGSFRGMPTGLKDFQRWLPLPWIIRIPMMVYAAGFAGVSCYAAYSSYLALPSWRDSVPPFAGAVVTLFTAVGLLAFLILSRRRHPRILTSRDFVDFPSTSELIVQLMQWPLGR